MTWIDIALIVILVLFVALGARMGSIWTGACLLGGFLGAFLVETYTLPLAEMLGGFAGARVLAGLMLFVGGVAVLALPGLIISRLASAFFLGIFDSVVGLFSGLLAGLLLVTVIFFSILPRFPSIETSRPWKKSVLVKPFHKFVEDVFNNSRFKKESTTDQLKIEFIEDVSPVLEDAGKKIKSTIKNIKK